jgi:hypothetical protein
MKEKYKESIKDGETYNLGDAQGTPQDLYNPWFANLQTLFF